MRKLAVALVASLLMACAQLASLNPFGGGGGGPAEMFAIAKAAYVGAFRSAATYVTLCQSQPPTESCDKFTVRLYDEVNPRARENIALGEGLLAGIPPAGLVCDEVANPGCQEAMEAQQLEMLAIALQQAAIILNARR